MIHRRHVGLVVVALGLLAAGFVPVAVGRTVAGSAEAVPVPGPPTVGDCVGRPFDIAGFMPDPAKYSYPEMTSGECSRPHYGEVVSVIARPTKPKIEIEQNGGFSIDDGNMNECYPAAGGFLGLSTSAGETKPLFEYWSIVAYPRVVPMTPTAREQAGGRHWVACVTFLFRNASTFGDTTSAISYTGTLRDAQSTGVGRNYLGYCPTEADWNQMTAVDCLQPHHGEVFGSASSPQDVARTTLNSSCAKLVGQVTRNADLLRDGRLMVSVQATDATGNKVTGAIIAKDSSLQCGVVTSGDQLLKGSLLAIGTEPIPWA